MTNLVEVSPEFKRDIKPLAKKYHTLKQSRAIDLSKVIKESMKDYKHVPRIVTERTKEKDK